MLSPNLRACLHLGCRERLVSCFTNTIEEKTLTSLILKHYIISLSALQIKDCCTIWSDLLFRLQHVTLLNVQYKTESPSPSGSAVAQTQSSLPFPAQPGTYWETSWRQDREWKRSVSQGKSWCPQPANLVCAWCCRHSFGHILLKEQHQENPEEFVSSHCGDELGQDGQAPVLWHVGQSIHKHTNDLDHHLFHASRGLRQVTVFSLCTNMGTAVQTGYCRWLWSRFCNLRKQEEVLRAR